MDDQLFNKVFKSIPNHFGELYLEPELREFIAKEVINKWITDNKRIQLCLNLD